VLLQADQNLQAQSQQEANNAVDQSYDDEELEYESEEPSRLGSSKAIGQQQRQL